jgi:acetyl-CoA synthetase
MAHEAVDRHARGSRARTPALRHVDRAGRIHDLSFAALAASSARFASVLTGLGVGAGERVFCLLPRVPELYTVVLGSLKARAVVCPLYPGFGPEPIRSRLALGRGRLLVTTEQLFLRRVESIRRELPDLEHVLLLGERAPAGTRSLAALMARGSASFSIAPTDPEDPALLHFTSGTTGPPKGALHVHDAVVAQHATARLALDLHPGDLFWCTADPGWVTGTVYGIVAPLAVGATVLVDEADFDPLRWLSLLDGQGVTVWYTTPTAIRLLRRLGIERIRCRRPARLRFAASVGEALDAESVHFGAEALGQPFHDTWWQTETGAIMIATDPALEIRAGAMGRPVPGIEAAIVSRRPDGGVEILDGQEARGELALRRGWPSMFRTYVGDDERYRRSFRDGWYLSGDLVERDRGDYYWYLGRADEAIESAGHLIGPAEVEAAILAHPAVSEAGVIGKPDPVAGETVKVYVVPAPGLEPSEELRREILAHARRRLGPAVAPKELDFRGDLPRTRSGKILRRLLRSEELGLETGDPGAPRPVRSAQSCLGAGGPGGSGNEKE